ncbi:glycosyltransferase [Pontibacter sp. 13R65]|uniref:glycosyltransferase n=1 Tax=Pontibacter sp. 13R65 TaxID=3127458 RepID=UPI00301DBA8F
MKYWLLTTEYPPFSGGGISTYSYITAKSLAKLGIEVTIFVPDQSIATNEVDNSEPLLRIVRFNPNYGGKSQILGYAANLSYSFAEIVKDFTVQNGVPNFIEAQDYLGIAYYLLQFKLTGLIALDKVPIIITLHSPAFVYLEYNRVPTYRFPEYWTCVMEKEAIIGADILISPTKFLIDEIQKYLDLKNKIVHILPNPFVVNIDRSSFEYDQNNVFFYGKLSAQKGTFKMLEYFKQVWEAGHEVKLTILGGTDIVYHPEHLTMLQIVKSRYRKYIENGKLNIKGKINNLELAQHLKKAHLVLVPSIIDNLPYVIFETMASVKPVLTSAQGGQKEVIKDGYNGFIFDHSEPESFVSKLIYILRKSREELNEVCQRAYDSLDRFSPDIILPKKIKILTDFQKNLHSSETISFPFVYQEKIRNNFIEPNNKILSIVIPYFNMGKYIDDCLESVQASDYGPKEIIIINDGSTDKYSLLKLDELRLHPNIKIIDQPNSGVAEARNKGAEASQGKYLAFLDADDRVSKSYYSKALLLLNKYDNVFFIGCWTKYFGESSTVWPTFNPQPPYILAHNSVNSSSLVYKRSAFLVNGKNDKDTDYGLEDYESVVNMMQSGCNGIVIPEVNFFYRIRSNSMIRSINKEKLLYSYKYIANKHHKYFSKFSVSLTNILTANGPGYDFDNPTLDYKILRKYKYFIPMVNRFKNKLNKHPFFKRKIIDIINLTKLIK